MPNPEDFAPGWLERIAQAQAETTVALQGHPFNRVPFGAEAKFAGLVLADRCHDCGVQLGWLHVPGCCTEVCPRCQRQAFGCGCHTERARSRRRCRA